MRAAWLAAGGLALAIGACGSSETNPPPAEPAASPPPDERPAGAVIQLGQEAEGVAFDPASGLVAVAVREPNRVDLIDLDRGRAVERIPTPGPARHLTLAAPGGPVLAPVEYDDQLLEISLPTGRATSVPTGDFPHDAARSADGRTFVGDEGGDTISVIEDDRTVETLGAPEQPGGLALSGDVLAVVAVAAREVAFFDAGSLEELALLPAGAGPSHVVAGGDGRFYVADTGGDAILVYEARPDGGGEPRLLDRANVPGGPYGIAIDDRRNRLWVTQTARNRVVELEITDLAPKILGDYPTVRQPNSVAVDSATGRVVVVGRTPGELQVIDPALEREGGSG